MTKEEFKRKWESDDDGGGITNDDCAQCYIEWGLGNSPRSLPIDYVVNKVVAAAGCRW